jgi:carboxyl-terminal processing protease
VSLARSVAFWIAFAVTACVAKEKRPVALTAEQRLVAFDEAWQTIRDGYYDTNYHGLDWAAIRDRYQPRAQSATNDYDFHAALRRMLVELRDGHTHYSAPPHVSNPNAKSTAFGVGFFIAQAEGRLVVSQVEAGSEAEQNGVRPGRTLHSVDGCPVATRWSELRELVQRENSHSTGHHLDYLLCQLFFDGDAGIPAVLALETADGATNVVQLKRRKAQLTFQEPPVLTALRRPSGMGYIRFNHWSPTLAKKLRSELKELLDTPGLIIDLRGNNGGDIDFNLEVAGHFLPPKTVLGESISRDGKKASWLSRPNKPVYQGRIAVLVDAGSLSGSEFFATYMRDCAKAVIVGRPSGGTLLKQTAKKIPGGGLLHYSTHDYRSPGGLKIEGVGIVPDNIVSIRIADLAQNRDPDVAAAEQILRQPLPRNGTAP